MQLYVEVEDLASSVTKANQMGAGIIVAPQTLPDGDELAIFVDPEGIPFAMFKTA